MSFCFLYNLVSENHSVQNSPWGGGGEGGLLSAQGLYGLRAESGHQKKYYRIFPAIRCFFSL